MISKKSLRFWHFSLEEEIDINPTISLILSKENDNKSGHYPH